MTRFLAGLSLIVAIPVTARAGEECRLPTEGAVPVGAPIASFLDNPWEPLTYCPAVSVPDGCSPYLVHAEIAIQELVLAPSPGCPQGQYAPAQCHQDVGDIRHACICNALQNYINAMCACPPVVDPNETTEWGNCMRSAEATFDMAMTACRQEYQAGYLACCQNTERPAGANAIDGPCPQNPNQQPVQWAAFAAGTITYGQWIAANPGFGTKVWACDDPARPADCARNAISMNGFCGCLGWLNPYEACRVYNP